MSHVSIDIQGPDGGLESRIEWAISGISNWTPVWRVINQEWPRNRRDMFATDGWGKWAGYTPAERMKYVPMKLAMTGRARLLRWEKGRNAKRLMKSLTEPAGNPDAVSTMNNNQLTLGTLVPYATNVLRGGRAPERLGGHSFPGRDFLMIGPALHGVINNAVGDLAGKVSKGVTGEIRNVDISLMGGSHGS